jgi:hypothetical protein
VIISIPTTFYFSLFILSLNIGQSTMRSKLHFSSHYIIIFEIALHRQQEFKSWHTGQDLCHWVRNQHGKGLKNSVLLDYRVAF